jgi:ubiquinone biosynthesis protein UbiJ
MLPSPTALLTPALNRLLDTQPALVATLGQHGGKVATVILPPFTLRLAITPEGRLAPAAADAPAAVSITLGADIPPRLLLGDREALRGARVDGDGGLANDLMGVLDRFDWALALRPWVGDILAARAAQALAGFGQWRTQARAALERNASGWFSQESGLLVDRLTMTRFVAETDELRDATERLAARLALLEGRSGTGD